MPPKPYLFCVSSVFSKSQSSDMIRFHLARGAAPNKVLLAHEPAGFHLVIPCYTNIRTAMARNMLVVIDDEKRGWVRMTAHK